MASEKTNQRREVVKVVLSEKGWGQDRWGNWIHPARPGIRYKLAERNLKKQAKHSAECGGRWFNLKSIPYGKLKLFAGEA